LHAFLARLGLVAPNSRQLSRELTVYGEGPEVRAMWRITKAILGTLAREVGARDARLIVLYVPARFEVNDSVWQLTRERYDVGPDWDRRRVFDALAGACSAIDVALVDPRAALSAAERDGPPAYYTRDAHWTAVGNRVAAEVLAPEVRASACP
jgi:hypothetical protein